MDLLGEWELKQQENHPLTHQSCKGLKSILRQSTKVRSKSYEFTCPPLFTFYLFFHCNNYQFHLIIMHGWDALLHVCATIWWGNITPQHVCTWPGLNACRSIFKYANTPPHHHHHHHHQPTCHTESHMHCFIQRWIYAADLMQCISYKPEGQTSSSSTAYWRNSTCITIQ